MSRRSCCVGAIATSSSADSGPGSASTRAVTSASRPSGSMTTSPGSTFGRGLERAEVVAGRVVEAVDRHCARYRLISRAPRPLETNPR